MYKNLKDQNVYYQKLGHGPDLILLHGWKNDVSSFWEIAQQISDQFTVYLIDLPGFGRSDNPQKAFTVSDYAEIIHEFIKELKLKKPDILGHSLGGRVSIKLAAKHPEVINRVILEDSAGIKTKKSASSGVFYLIAKIFKFVPNLGNLKERLRSSFYKGRRSDYYSAGEMRQTLVNILEEDLTPDLGDIKNETLLLWGEDDIDVPLTQGRRMYRMIPNSKIEVIEGAGHFPHTEKPEMFLYFVKDFLS